MAGSLLRQPGGQLGRSRLEQRNQGHKGLDAHPEDRDGGGQGGEGGGHDGYDGDHGVAQGVAEQHPA